MFRFSGTVSEIRRFPNDVYHVYIRTTYILENILLLHKVERAHELVAFSRRRTVGEFRKGRGGSRRGGLFSDKKGNTRTSHEELYRAVDESSCSLERVEMKRRPPFHGHQAG